MSAAISQEIPGARYRTIKKVPLFDAHEPTEKTVRDPAKGPVRMMVGCTAADLGEMASNANEAAARGRHPVVQLGHGDLSGPDLPEAELPKVVGRASNFSVGLFEGRPCLFGDLSIHESHYDEASSFPRLSVERIGWDRAGRQTIRAVALIRREPERDLPLVNYGRDRVLCYAKERPMQLASAAPYPTDPATRRRIVDHALRRGLTASQAAADLQAEDRRVAAYAKEAPALTYPTDPAVRAKVVEHAARLGTSNVDLTWRDMVTKGLASA